MAIIVARITGSFWTGLTVALLLFFSIVLGANIWVRWLRWRAARRNRNG